MCYIFQDIDLEKFGEAFLVVSNDTLSYVVLYREIQSKMMMSQSCEDLSLVIVLCICLIFTHTRTHTHLMALCPGLPGWAGTRKVKPILVFTEARKWVTATSAGPYANNLQLPPDRLPCQHPTTQFVQALPAAQPTASKHWRHCLIFSYIIMITIIIKMILCPIYR